MTWNFYDHRPGGKAGSSRPIAGYAKDRPATGIRSKVASAVLEIVDGRRAIFHDDCP